MLLTNEQMGGTALSILRAHALIKNESRDDLLQCADYFSREAEIPQGKAKNFLSQLLGRASILSEVEMQGIALKFWEQRISNFLHFLKRPTRGSHTQKKSSWVEMTNRVRQELVDNVKKVGFSDEIATQFVQQIFGDNAS